MQEHTCSTRLLHFIMNSEDGEDRDILKDTNDTLDEKHMYKLAITFRIMS